MAGDAYRKVKRSLELAAVRATVQLVQRAPVVPTAAAALLRRAPPPSKQFALSGEQGPVPTPDPPPPEVVADPAALEAVLLTKAPDAEDRVRVLGKTCSHSVAKLGATHADYLRLGAAFVTTRPVDLAQDPLRAGVDATRLYRVGAAAPLTDVLTVLEAHGHTLHAQPGYASLTLGGVLATSSQGSGVEVGPLADDVRSVSLTTVDATGSVVLRVVEGKDGPTDATKLPADVVLHQDDDLFRAVRGSLGLCGVVTSVLLEATDAYNLREELTEVPWSWLRDNLVDVGTGTAGGLESAELWINAMSLDPDEPAVIVRRWRTKEAPNQADRGEGVEETPDDKLLEIARWVAEDLGVRPTALIRCALRAAQPRIKGGVFPVRTAGVSRDFGAKNALPMGASAVSVPLDKVGAAIDATFEVLDARWKQGFTVISPLGVRFCKGGEAWLSPQHRGPCALLELPSYRQVEDLDGTLTAWLLRMMQDFGARPHLGLFFDAADPTTVGLIRAAFGTDLDAFRKARATLDPRNLHGGPMSDALGV